MIYMNKYVNGKLRYYCIELQKNLFDEYIVINQYGSNCNKKPTGVINNFFKHKLQALDFLKAEKLRKMKKQYKIIKDDYVR